MSDYVQQNFSITSFHTLENWVICEGFDDKIKSKIEKFGKRLGDWKLNIYRGILTGYNDAFIIDQKTKDCLISQNPNCVDFIRPILRGRDIKRYTYENSHQFLIAFPCGFTNSISKHESATNWLHSSHPEIENVLLDHSNSNSSKSKGLMNRDDQGDYWWELRHCAYWNVFNGQVIAWQRITHENQFVLTQKGDVVLDSMAFISGAGKYAYYFLALLNSPLMLYWMKKTVPQYGNTGFRLSNQFVSIFPAKEITENELTKIDLLVKDYLKSSNEKELFEINAMIYKFYNLTDDEIVRIIGS